MSSSDEDDNATAIATYVVAMHLHANRKVGIAVRWYIAFAAALGIYLASWWPLMIAAGLSIATYFFLINSCVRFIHAKTGIPAEGQAVFSEQYKKFPEFRRHVDGFMAKGLHKF